MSYKINQEDNHSNDYQNYMKPPRLNSELEAENASLKERVVTLEKLQGIALIETLRAEIERLNALSVTNIMIDVVPGWDGSGEEVFAKSVDDVESLLSKLSEKAEDFDLVTEPLRQQLAASQLEAKQLRDAIFDMAGEEPAHSWKVAKKIEALSSPTSTEALDAYVAEKVEEAIK